MHEDGRHYLWLLKSEEVLLFITFLSFSKQFYLRFQRTRKCMHDLVPTPSVGTTSGVQRSPPYCLHELAANPCRCQSCYKADSKASRQSLVLTVGLPATQIFVPVMPGQQCRALHPMWNAETILVFLTEQSSSEACCRPTGPGRDYFPGCGKDTILDAPYILPN